MTAGDASLGVMPKWKIEEEPNYSIEKYRLYFVNRTEAMNQLREIHRRTFERAKINTGLDWVIALCDNIFGLGKSELSNHYIRWCINDWKDPDHFRWTIEDWMERSKHQLEFKEILSQSYSVHLDFRHIHMRNARDFELIFLNTLKLALIKKFETAPKCLFHPHETTREFLIEFVANAGPVFIILDEFGKAFEMEGRGVLEERELFLMFCEKIVLWQSVLGVCMLVLGKGGFFNYVGARPPSPAPGLSMLRTSPCLFERLSLRFLRKADIIEILQKTYWTKTIFAVEYFKLDSNKTEQVANHLIRQTLGHPRSLVSALRQCNSFDDLMKYSCSNEIRNYKDFFEFAQRYKIHMNRIYAASESNQILDLSENIDVDGRKLPLEIIVINSFIAWDGNLEQARLFPSETFKNFMATYFMPFREYIQLIAQSIRSGLIVDFGHAFELMIAKRFQEMFSMKIRPSKVSPSFFKTDLFGECGEIMLHPDLSPMPRIMSRGLGAGLKAQTADFSQWPALWEEILDRVSNQGSVSLKPFSFSESPDVIFACILNKKSDILDFILGLAIKNYQKPSKVTNITINDEIKKYDNMFQPHDRTRRKECLKVLMICATEYTEEIKKEFGDQKFYVEKNPSRNIDELVVLDLCSSNNRAEFFDLHPSGDLSKVVEDVIAQIHVNAK